MKSWVCMDNFFLFVNYKMETLVQLFNSYDIDNDGFITSNDFKHAINILDLKIINIDTNKQYSYDDLIEYIKMHHNIKTINIQNIQNILNKSLSDNDIKIILSEITGNINNEEYDVNITQINDYLNKISVL